MESTAITQGWGSRTATGITGIPTQTEVHQGQWARYEAMDVSPQRRTTHCRYPTVNWSSTRRRVTLATARQATTMDRINTLLLYGCQEHKG